MENFDKLTEGEKRRLNDMALHMIETREVRERVEAARKAMEEAERPQREYINRLCDGVTPKRAEGILAMNYCIAWQKAWGKALQDWIDNGFHRVPYGRRMNKNERKYVQYKMEMAQ